MPVDTFIDTNVFVYPTVAAALAADCRRLLTEDLQDGQRIEALTVVDPFPAERGAQGLRRLVSWFSAPFSGRR